MKTKSRVAPKGPAMGLIIQTVEHNRHEDVGLQKEVGNALTMSGLRAYYKRQVAFVSPSHQAMVHELLLG
jgi:hypothetical protein